MPNDHPTEEDLVMLYYCESGLVQHGSPDELRMHLESCPSCGAAYQNLMRVLDACDDLPVPEPHPAFESRMWNRLEPQLHPLDRPFHPFPQASAWSFLRTRWFAAAAVAAMLTVAFLAGRFTRTPNRPARIVLTTADAITADGRQRVLLMALGDHLERSQMVLTELANVPDQSADLLLERERARDLISENRLYRQTAAASGDPAVAQLLDELERVLLDISHGTDAQEIKSRIDSESLIFKLRVLGSNLNRSNSSAPKPSQETL
jgi:hypothetical protein